MARDYNIGWFTEPVAFLLPVKSVTDTGERTVSYYDERVHYCEVDDIKYSDELTQEALAEEQTHTLKTWTVDKASTEWRVRYRGDIYNIIRIEHQRNNKTIYYIRRTDLCNE